MPSDKRVSTPELMREYYQLATATDSYLQRAIELRRADLMAEFARRRVVV
jgi:hypothetical protein